MSCICSPRMEKKSLHVKRVRDPLILISRKNKAVRLKKLDERLDFNITRDDLTRFMEGETPANAERSAAGLLKYLTSGKRPRLKQ